MNLSIAQNFTMTFLARGFTLADLDACPLEEVHWFSFLTILLLFYYNPFNTDVLMQTLIWCIS